MTSGITISDLPEKYRQQALQQLGLDLPAPGPGKPKKRVPESKLQADAEKYLEFRGYDRLTQKKILGGAPEKGWFAHWPIAKGNPIMLDLLILSNEPPYRFMMIELKTDTGRTKKHQAALIVQCKSAILCRSVDEVRRALDAWESNTTEERPK